MSSATPAVITAALGLLVGYDSAVAAETAGYSASAPHEQKQELQALAEEIHALVRNAKELERTYMSVAKSYAQGSLSPIPQDAYLKLTELLTNLRGVELGLKNAEVPVPLSSLHMEARRAIAKGRSWVAVVHDIMRQASVPPDSIDGKANGEALRALADHATKRLVELANA